MEILTDIGLSTSVIAAILLVRQVFEIVAKAIPDDAGGALGIVRRIAKVISLYTVSRKTSGDELG